MQEIIVLLIVSLATLYSIYTFVRQFSTSTKAGCSSCPECAIPAADSLSSSYIRYKSKKVSSYKE